MAGLCDGSFSLSSIGLAVLMLIPVLTAAASCVYLRRNSLSFFTWGSAMHHVNGTRLRDAPRKKAATGRLVVSGFRSKHPPSAQPPPVTTGQSIVNLKGTTALGWVPLMVNVWVT